jgi:hypothetical protein
MADFGGGKQRKQRRQVVGGGPPLLSASLIPGLKTRFKASSRFSLPGLRKLAAKRNGPGVSWETQGRAGEDDRDLTEQAVNARQLVMFRTFPQKLPVFPKR